MRYVPTPVLTHVLGPFCVRGQQRVLCQTSGYALFGFMMLLQLLLQLLLLATFGNQARAEQQTFTACTETHSQPPFFMGTGDTFSDENPGIIVEIIANAVKEAGLKPIFKRLPWKRCLNLLERNKVDGVFASIYLKEREILGRFPLKSGTLDLTTSPDPYRRLTRVVYSLFKHKNSSLNWDGNKLSNLQRSIGAPLGYVVVKKLKNEHSIEATTAHTIPEGFQHVALGHLDAYIIESNIGHNLIRELNLGDSLIEIKPSFAEYDWYLMISHKFYNANPELAEKIWSAIGDYRVGHMQKLLEHYRNLP